MSSRKELLLVFPLLCLLVLLPFWRVAMGQGLVITNDYAVSDIANQYHPMRHFAGGELRQGRLPLWVPGIYMGFPLLGEGQTGLFYPFNLLSYALLPTLTAVNLSILWPFVVAAVGACLLARELGASIAGASLAALSYALSGFFVVHVKHMPMVDAACWIPLLIWLVERGVKRSDGALLGAGLVMGVQWLAGAPQIAYYSAGVATLYFAGRTWEFRRERSPRRTVPLFTLALILSVGLGAIQLLPTYELVGFSERSGGVDYAFASAFPYAPENLKTFLSPRANGGPGTGDYNVSSIFWEDYAYLGLLPLFLGLVGGLVLARRSGLARLLAGLTALTSSLALGTNTPLFRLTYLTVPGWGFFRFPQRLFAFAVLFLVVLAALSLSRFQEWIQGRRGTIWMRSKLVSAASDDGGRKWSRILGGVVLLLVVVDLYAYHARWNAIVDADAWLEPPATAVAVQERAGSSLYRVFTFDAFNTFRAAYHQAGGWRGDLEPYVAQREFLQPSLNLIYDVSAAGGYINLVPDCLTTLWGTEKQLGLMDRALVRAEDHLLVKPGFDKLLNVYNVRFLITPEPVQDEALELVGVYGSGAHLYENVEAMPRAYVVPKAIVVDDLQAAFDQMLSAAFDPTKAVILLDAPDVVEDVSEDLVATAIVKTYEPSHVVVGVGSSGPGWLVLSDTHYPGWEAIVDGRATPIYQANGCVRAVPVEEGQHEIAFRFRPRSFYRGAWISGISAGLFATIWLTLTLSKRPRRN